MRRWSGRQWREARADAAQAARPVQRLGSGVPVRSPFISRCLAAAAAAVSSVLVGLALITPTSRTAHAQGVPPAFTIVAESAVFNPATQDVAFRIEFSKSPDFATLDTFGRQANSFQYFIVGDSAQPDSPKFDSIIRGEEIHVTSNQLRIRNVAPADPDPAAGGWGTLRGTVPFQLNGRVLTFSAPLKLVSDHSRNGAFAYQLEAYDDFGSLTAHVDGQSVTAGSADASPPVTTASVSPRLNAAGWERKAVSVTLSAADGAGGSGVKAITFSATGAQTIARTTVSGAHASVPPITAEGSTTVAFFATDQAGNTEATRTVVVQVDQTAPEALLRFDPARRDLVVIGQDALSGVAAGPVAPVSVTPTTWKPDDEDGSDDDRQSGQAEVRTYQLHDAAGNSLRLGLEVRMGAHQLRARVVSLQINGAAVVSPARNSLRLQWELDRAGHLQELRQEVRVGAGKDQQTGQARFEASDNQTRIQVKGAGRQQQLTRPGLVPLELATSQGALRVAF